MNSFHITEGPRGKTGKDLGKRLEKVGKNVSVATRQGLSLQQLGDMLGFFSKISVGVTVQ